jgi:hypothetical protein
MKKVILVLSLLLFSSAGFGQYISIETLSNLNTPKYRGKPKVVIERFQYFEKDNPIYTSIDSLDNRGRIINRTSFDKMGNQNFAIYYIYDSVTNRMVEEKHMDLKKSVWLKSTRYTYAETSLWLVEQFDSTGIIDFIEIKRDVLGKIVKLIRTITNHQYIWEKAEYHQEANALVATRFNYNGYPEQVDTLAIDNVKPNLLRKNYESLNKNGDFSRRVLFYFGEPSQTREYEYKYDKYLNWTELKSYEVKSEKGKLNRKVKVLSTRQFIYE